MSTTEFRPLECEPDIDPQWAEMVNERISTDFYLSPHASVGDATAAAEHAKGSHVIALEGVGWDEETEQGANLQTAIRVPGVRLTDYEQHILQTFKYGLHAEATSLGRPYGKAFYTALRHSGSRARYIDVPDSHPWIDQYYDLNSEQGITDVINSVRHLPFQAAYHKFNAGFNEKAALIRERELVIRHNHVALLGEIAMDASRYIRDDGMKPRVSAVFGNVHGGTPDWLRASGINIEITHAANAAPPDMYIPFDKAIAQAMEGKPITEEDIVRVMCTSLVVALAIHESKEQPQPAINAALINRYYDSISVAALRKTWNARAGFC
jgi:hypothetical protein